MEHPYNFINLVDLWKNNLYGIPFSMSGLPEFLQFEIDEETRTVRIIEDENMSRSVRIKFDGMFPETKSIMTLDEILKHTKPIWKKIYRR